MHIKVRVEHHPQHGATNLRWASPSLSYVEGWHARPGKETVTEELLPQHLESPSGTGRVVTPMKPKHRSPQPTGRGPTVDNTSLTGHYVRDSGEGGTLVAR